MVALLRSQHSTKCLTLFLAGLAIYLLWMDVGFYLELQVAARILQHTSEWTNAPMLLCFSAATGPPLARPALQLHPALHLLPLPTHHCQAPHVPAHSPGNTNINFSEF